MPQYRIHSGPVFLRDTVG